MSVPRAAQGLAAEPNVTPMIDVMLVLLVMFIMIILGLRQQVMVVQAPDPEARGGPPSAPLVLDVASGGAYALDHQAIAGRPALRATLRRVYAGRGAEPLFVRGLAGASYQDVISALDDAKGVGVKVVAFAPRAPATR